MAKQAKTKPKRAVGANFGRTRKLTKKQQRAKDKKAAQVKKIPNSFRLTAQVFKTLRQFWRPLLGIVIVYLILNIIFASGIGSIGGSLDSIKANLNSGTGHLWLDGAGSFLGLVGSAGAGSNATGSALQFFLFILESLVIIWALRHLLAGHKISVKQAYYNATTPLVPFLLVLFVIIIQLLPVTLGSITLSAVANSLGSVSGFWTALFVLIFLLLAAWSARMLCSSVIAAYIVTLPNMQPRDALHSAKKLVRFRRLMVLRRVLFLPLVILIAMGIIIIPLIMYATFLSAIVFYVLSMIAILFAHTYLYSLYRSLLNE